MAQLPQTGGEGEEGHPAVPWIAMVAWVIVPFTSICNLHMSAIVCSIVYALGGNEHATLSKNKLNNKNK